MRNSPDSSFGSSVSRNATRVLDSEMFRLIRFNIGAIASEKRRIRGFGGMTTSIARRLSDFTRWWLPDVPVTIAANARLNESVLKRQKRNSRDTPGFGLVTRNSVEQIERFAPRKSGSQTRGMRG